MDSEAFLTLLASLDDSLAFVAAHPQYVYSLLVSGSAVLAAALHVDLKALL